MNTKFFPFSTIRPTQQRVMDTVNKNLKKRYFICEIPTGGGKSGLAVQAARSDGNGYIITDSIQLQSQYEKDFGDLLVNVKGKSNYRCYINPSTTCAFSVCSAQTEEAQKQMAFCAQKKCCPYKETKARAEKSNIFLTNYAFLISSSTFGVLNKRNDIIFDEAHLLEKHLTQFSTIDINVDILEEKYQIFSYALEDEKKILKKSLKSFNGDYDVLLRTLNSVCKRKYDKEEKHLNNMSKSLLDAIKGKDDTTTSSILENASQAFINFRNIVNNLDAYQRTSESDWIISLGEVDHDGEKVDSLQIRPLKVDWIFKEYLEPLASDHIYFFSATILDEKLFCDTLGIPMDQVCFIREDSTFDPKKSPIYKICNCSTSYSDLQNEENKKRIVEDIKAIMAIYPNSKGIIHSGNKQLSNYIKKNILSKRLLVNDGIQNNRDIFEKHIKSKEPTILVSSSMAEGVDLKEDLSRFQIIVKMPFDSLGDARIKKLSQIRKNWYLCEMFKKFIQQCGRSTRTEKDSSDTFILDSKFNSYLAQAKSNGWLTSQFIERIKSM